MELVYDNISIGRGRGIIIYDKAALYGVAIEILFIYEEGGGGTCILVYLSDVKMWIYIVLIG